MLLGQNVDSYGMTLDPKVKFSELLEEVEKVEGIKRIRFMSPNPEDFADEVIEVMAKSKKIEKHVHMPLQSGSDRILKRMNRNYTKQQFLDIVNKIKEKIPGVELTTDIIVGFPGETEEDFLDTMDVCEKVGFASAYTFIYSKRTGTPAALMEDQVPEDVVSERFDRLLKVVQRKSAEASEKYVGSVVEVLVEEKDTEPGMLTGRLSNNMLVHFKADESLLGEFVNVHIDESKGFYFFGSLV
jgi:tRNA-2-methylthio-N6-dimethylallyladenosine synthase